VAWVCTQAEYVFFQAPLYTSVCRSSKNGRRRQWGWTPAEGRKLSSSLKRMTACFSFGQSMF